MTDATTEEITALHTQIAHLDARLTDRDDRMDRRLERIERSLLGDGEVGLKGMVDRVDALDLLAGEAEATHASIRQEAKDGDRRLHQRIDELEGKWKTAIGIAIGASIGSAGGAAALVRWVG